MLRSKWFVIPVSTVFGAVLGCMTVSEPADPGPRTVKPVPTEHQQTAVFAGGCFWCVEADFEKTDGVIEVVSGYSGGVYENPTYEEVCRHETDHVEAVQVTWDDRRLTYDDLLQVFWRSMDPTDAGGQFADRGASYHAAIFVENEEQRQAAERSKQELQESARFDRPIVTPVRDATVFYPAEEYHQDYYRKNPGSYSRYRSGSGRDSFLKRIWGEDRYYHPARTTVAKPGRYQRPSDSEIRNRLTALQFQVTQEEGTESPFRNEYWDNKKAGIYVDVVSGEPLFSSRHKFRSGTGWPSFYRPLVEEHVVSKTDYKLVVPRTEVRSRFGDSHLGHVFEDGPQPTGLRYCINSAALKFIPQDELEQSGYGEYVSHFDNVER